jgi:iron complex transport system substrate-binding protein
MNSLLYLLVFCLLLTPAASGADIAVIDDAGRRITLDRPARRIVSLAPHATELLFAAGAGPLTVGAVSYSDYPAAARQIARVGDAASLNLEAIVALQPELVVAWQSGNNANQVRHLIASGIPVFFSEPRRLGDIATNIERLGTLAGTDAVSHNAAQAFRSGYRRLAEEFSRRAPVRVFYQIWHNPPITVNGDHLISQIIELCGGRNVFAAVDGLAPTVSREAVLAADPQVIVASEGAARGRPQWLDSWLDWPQLSAAALQQLYAIDPDLIERQSPRILEGAGIMCRQLEQARSAIRR